MTKLQFAYLMYSGRTNPWDTSKILVGCFASLRNAKTHMDAMPGEYIDQKDNRVNVLHKEHTDTGSEWYVEKHVMKDAL